jgi:hypothetical protein
MTQEDTIQMAVRVSRATHEALLERQRKVSEAAGAQVPLTVILRGVIDEALGVKPKNGKRRKQ